MDIVIEPVKIEDEQEIVINPEPDTDPETSIVHLYKNIDYYDIDRQVDIKQLYLRHIRQKRLEQQKLETGEIRVIQPMEITIEPWEGPILNPENGLDPDSELVPSPDQEDEPVPIIGTTACGPWGSDCKSCCYFLCNVCQKTVCSRCVCCNSIMSIVRPFYFFILYLFTSEVNSEADMYIDYFNIKIKNDQDEVSAMQVMETMVYICFELYKTLIGSFLTVFTSQRCGNRTCTIWENIVPKNDLELTGIVLNFLMATTLFIEYIFEIMREAYLIKYLKYDNNIANNGLHIASMYRYSDRIIFMKLMPLYIYYIRFSYVVLLVYIINVVVSAIIIETNYYDNTSLFSFVTNALFIVYKIYNVVEVTSYKGNYFYSAYKRKNIHYNTIKPKYIHKDLPNMDDAV
jgi:hypothetical protein